MKRSFPSLFLARQSYRRRRMSDAARLLPVLGSFLVLLPILWKPAETPEADTVFGVIYLFSVWTLLILAAFLLSRVLPSADAAPDPQTDDPETRRPGAENGPGTT